MICDWVLTPGDCCDGWEDYTQTAQERGIILATSYLWAATGRQFGQCLITVQPCRGKRGSDLYRTYPVTLSSGSGAFFPYILDGQWHNAGWCKACCESRCEVRLDGPMTLDAVQEVRLDGVIVDPSSYTVQTGNRLVRIDGECWPCCIDYGQQNPPEWEVDYLIGLPVPADVVIAAEILACEFAAACAGGPCRLPSRVASLDRQGVSVDFTDIDTSGQQLLTGIEEIDGVIRTYNPYARIQRSRIYSPDKSRQRQVATYGDS